jgi:hypothetical protein
MRSRPVLLCTLSLALIAGGSALAGPTPACRLVTDVTGDGMMDGGQGLIKSDAMDITGGDVASGKKEVVGVIRVKSLNTSGDPFAWLKYSWMIAFKINGQDFNFSAARAQSPTGAMVNSGTEKFTFGPDSITFRVPRKDFEPLVKKPGRYFIDNIAVTSSVNGTSADSALGGPTAKIKDFYPSCLKAK